MLMNSEIAALRQQIQQLNALHADGTLGTAAFETAKAPLERKLLDSVLSAPEPAADVAGSAAAGMPSPGGWLVAVLAVSVIGLAVAGYAYTGAPGATVMAQLGDAAAAPGVDSNASEEAQFAAAVEQLAQRLQNEPDNTEGWAMLARSYARLGQHEKALPAFKKTGALLESDARLIADYADTLAVLNNRSLAGEPAMWVDKALKIDANNPKALALAGTGAFETGDFRTAVRHWERLADNTPPNAEFLPQLQASIAEARQKAGMPPAAVPAALPLAAAPAGMPTAAATPAGTATGPAVQGSVRLSAALAAQAQPGDTLFIFARAAEGPRMPLAIVRHTVKDLPLVFKLDDSMAMAPEMRLSLHPKVIISARISKSGQATPTAGDLLGESAAVANNATGVAIEINELVRN